MDTERQEMLEKEIQQDTETLCPSCNRPLDNCDIGDKPGMCCPTCEFIYDEDGYLVGEGFTEDVDKEAVADVL